MDEIKTNDNNSEDNYELYRNLFSNQIFKPTDESYNKKDGLLNEKQIKFQSDRNGFLFSDGKIELEKNYLSDNEFSFGEAVDFIKQLEHNSWKINLKVKVDQAWNYIKSFFGFVNENQHDEQRKLEAIFGSIANDLQLNNISKKFDELRLKAKKLDDALNTKIESADRGDLTKISLEIKKCYFEFESLIKEILNVAKKIICQEEYLSTERLNIIKKKYGYRTENYKVMENTFNMVKKIIECSDSRKMEKCSDMFNELLDLLKPDNIKKLESRKDLINDIKQIVSFGEINLRDVLDRQNRSSALISITGGKDKIVACDNLYKMLSDIELTLDNENLFYKIIDDEISEIEMSLSEYNKDLILKAKKYENQLRQMSNQKKSELLSYIQDIYQAYKYTNCIISNKANENLLLFKTSHNYYFWLYSHSELFLIGYLFRFIAWIMTKCSGNLESDCNRYKIALEKIEVLSGKSNSNIKSEDEFKKLCNKIFKNENENEINTSSQNFFVNENINYDDLAEHLFNEIKNKFSQYNPSLNVDKNSLDDIIMNFSNQVASDKKKLQQILPEIKNQKNKIEQNLGEKIDLKADESEKLLDIYEMNLKIKQLNAPYKILSALESQVRILEANRPMISILTSKLLDIPAEKIKGKSVDQLLRIKDIPPKQNDEQSEPPIIKTLYLSKDKLTKIKGKQSKNIDRGSFNTVFKHKNKILKPGKMQMICSSDNKSYLNGEVSRLNCFKKNSSVLVDTAVKGNVAYEAAKLFNLNCIVSTSIAISDDNHISVMEDAHENGRVFWWEINNVKNYQQEDEQLSANKLPNVYKLSCSELDSDDMNNSVIEKVHDKKIYPVFRKQIKYKNEKNEQERKKKKVQRLRKFIEKPKNAYKLFVSISELNFLDVLLLQIDRHYGNYSYNAVSIKGIDNDFIMPTKSGLLINNMNKYMGIYDSGENKYLSARPRKYKKNSIEQLAMLKIPVIPKELHDKIMNISSENLRTVLNIFYIDDDCGKEKVDFAIERFEEIKKLISNNVIKIADKFDDNVMSEILTQYDLCRIEKFIATNDGKNIEAYYLSQNVFENPMLEITTNHQVQNLISDKNFGKHLYNNENILMTIKEEKQFYSDWLDVLIKNENPEPKIEEKKYYEELKEEIKKVDDGGFFSL